MRLIGHVSRITNRSDFYRQLLGLAQGDAVPKGLPLPGADVLRHVGDAVGDLLGDLAGTGQQVLANAPGLGKGLVPMPVGTTPAAGLAIRLVDAVFAHDPDLSTSPLQLRPEFVATTTNDAGAYVLDLPADHAGRQVYLVVDEGDPREDFSSCPLYRSAVFTVPAEDAFVTPVMYDAAEVADAEGITQAMLDERFAQASHEAGATITGEVQDKAVGVHVEKDGATMDFAIHVWGDWTTRLDHAVMAWVADYKQDLPGWDFVTSLLPCVPSEAALQAKARKAGARFERAVNDGIRDRIATEVARAGVDKATVEQVLSAASLSVWHVESRQVGTVSLGYAEYPVQNLVIKPSFGYPRELGLVRA